MDQLVRHQQTINDQLVRYGVKFGLYKNGTFQERLFPFDPLPRVITAQEFRTLAHSLNVIGTRCLVVEMGVGMRLTKSYGEQLVDGILNLMHTQGMWAGETKPPRKPIVSKHEVAFKVIRRLHGGCL